MFFCVSEDGDIGKGITLEMAFTDLQHRANRYCDPRECAYYHGTSLVVNVRFTFTEGI